VKEYPATLLALCYNQEKYIFEHYNRHIIINHAIQFTQQNYKIFFFSNISSII